MNHNPFRLVRKGLFISPQAEFLTRLVYLQYDRNIPPLRRAFDWSYLTPMIQAPAPTNSESDLFSRLRANAKRLYGLPLDFWRPILGDECHFHLGHFSQNGLSLTESMRAAVARLASHARPAPGSRLLDVGCGWGGPGFQLAGMWDATVHGLTFSKPQVDNVNEQALAKDRRVSATLFDFELEDFGGRGSYDVALLYESLDHVWNRDRVIARLRRVVRNGGWLLIAIHCRAPHIERSSLHGEFMGIPPLETVDGLAYMVESSGWTVMEREDCTYLTEPVWERWIENTHIHDCGPLATEAQALREALVRTQHLYSSGMLCSVQLCAVAE